MYAVPGAITLANASAALAGLHAAIDGGETEIGLAAITGSDSSAVAVFAAAARHADGGGRTLRWTAVPASVRSLARLYGVDVLLGLGAPPGPAD